MTPILWCTIPGDPVTKGRPRMTGTGRPYTPTRTRHAEADMGWALQQAMRTWWKAQRVRRRQVLPIAGVNLGVVLGFYAATKRRADLDNMVKLVWDAANGILWQDDSQITELRASVVRGSSEPHTDVMVYIP